MVITFPYRLLITVTLAIIGISFGYVLIENMEKQENFAMAISQAEQIIQQAELLMNTGVREKSLNVEIPPGSILYVGAIPEVENSPRDVITVVHGNDLKIVDSEINFSTSLILGTGSHNLLLISRNGEVEVRLIE